jgi:hypothetical protein
METFQHHPYRPGHGRGFVLFPALRNGLVHPTWESAWAWENLKMAQGVGFILACAFLYGLTAFLFRDQIKGMR